MRERLTNKKNHIVFKTINTFIMAFSLTLVIVGFQNCNDKVSFRSVENGSTGQSNTSSSSSNGESESSTSGSSSSRGIASGESSVAGGSSATAASYKVGSNYGACTMQLEDDLTIAHNGLIDKNGTRIPTVPEGVGGATWPITNCPYSGNYKSASIDCATGFKPVLMEYSQMDCRTGLGAPACSTYWATYSCARLSTGTVTPPASSSPSAEYAAGTVAGSCVQQLDSGWNGVSRSHPDSILSESNVGAVWPVTSCPDNLGNLAVKCASGWKLAAQSVVQFICPGTPVGGFCNRYIVRSSCVKI